MNKFVYKFRKCFKEKLSIFHCFNLVLILVAFILPFLAAYTSSDAKKEEMSNYITDRVKFNTRNKSIMAVSVGTTNQSGALPIDEEREFYSLYGIFRQENITYASGFNINKEHVITIPDLNNDINYSIFFNAKDSTVEYHGHYKHWYYPIEYMFEAVRLYEYCRYMIYITQSQADALLEKDGIQRSQDGVFLEKDYKSLIKRLIKVNIDGQDETCIIGNIIYEQNYYYNGLKEVLNDFFAIAYYYPEGISLTNMYFFNNYSYQNTYFMNYINRVYNNKLYDVQVVKNNIINEFNFNNVTNFYYGTYFTNNFVFITFIIFALILISITSVINFSKCWKINYKYFFLCGVSIFLPYLIFFIIYKLRHSTLLFSSQGITLYVYFILFFIGIHLLIFIINRIYKYRLERKSMICKR